MLEGRKKRHVCCQCKTWEMSLDSIRIHYLSSHSGQYLVMLEMTFSIYRSMVCIYSSAEHVA